MGDLYFILIDYIYFLIFSSVSMYYFIVIKTIELLSIHMKLDLKCFAKINVNNHIKVLTFKSTLIIFLICPSNSSLDAPISESLTCDSWPSLLPLLCASRTPCGYLMLALIMLYYGDIYNFRSPQGYKLCGGRS